MKVTQFLTRLNEVYTDIRGQLLTMNPMPPLTSAHLLLQQEERQRNYVHMAQLVIESAALLSKSRFYSNDFEKSDQLMKPCFRRNNLECTYYHGKNHTRK